MARFECITDETLSNLTGGVADLYEQCHFDRIDFAGMNLSKTTFVECRFVGCSFAGVKIAHAGVNCCHFDSCKLVGINFGDFAQETLSVRFSNCRLDSCMFDSVEMKKTDFGKSDLFRCEFSRANLWGSLFCGCDCRESRFINCNVEQADFSEAKELAIDLRSNRVAGAKFSISSAEDLLSYFGVVLT